MPDYGLKYDKHLLVELIDESALEYRVTAPSEIDGFEFGKGHVAYFNSPYKFINEPSDADEAVEAPHHYSEVVFKREGSRFIGTFKLKKSKADLYPVVEVLYHVGCGAVAMAAVEWPAHTPDSNPEPGS